MRAFLKTPELKPYKFQIEKLLRYKPHILSEPEERLLAMQGEVGESVSKIFGQLNDADLKFGFVVNERGEKVELTQSSGRGLLESPKRSVRKETFDKLYAAYQAHANTLAATLQGFRAARRLSRTYGAIFLRPWKGRFFSEKVPQAVYDNLIEAVHQNLDTVYHYFEVRRKALKLKKIHLYDTYVPMVKMDRRKTPYPDAAETVCNALAAVGRRVRRDVFFD